MQPHSVPMNHSITTRPNRWSRLGLIASIVSIAALQGCIATPTSGLERMNNAVVYGEMSIDDPEIVVATQGPVDIDIDSFGGTVVVDVGCRAG